MTDIEVSRLSDADRIGDGIKRGVSKLSPALQAQLQALVTPQALGVAAAFFIAWLVSHAVGIGFVVDAIFLGVGVVAVGFAVFSGVDELIQFGNGAISARNNAQLDQAAEHFARGVSILGVQAVVALLLRRAPQTYRGGRVSVGPPRPAPAFRSGRACGPRATWSLAKVSPVGGERSRFHGWAAPRTVAWWRFTRPCIER